MRLSTAAASILAIGLVVAACGGDEATPAPADEATPPPTGSEPVTDASVAPLGDASVAPAADASPAGDTAFAKTAQVTNEADPAATYGLVAGRYRMGWTTGRSDVDPPIPRCEQVDILVTQVDGDFTYPKKSRSSVATAIINDLPEGIFTIEQLDPACPAWNIRVDWMTN